jgi:glutamate N-acetyltransferase/amino-acid N-acetyltransferase
MQVSVRVPKKKSKSLLVLEPKAESESVKVQVPRPDGKGVTYPKGFKAAGVHCGIRKAKKDVAIIASELAASYAAAYTTNKVKAAPVIVCEQNLSDGCEAVVVNSGNANCMTGSQGMADAWEMVNLTAHHLGMPAERVAVASTGVIGRALPMKEVRIGIKEAAHSLDFGPQAGMDASDAILTTDTFPKLAEIEVELSGGKVRLGGMAKGAGMIAPEMRVGHATTLSFVTTDAQVAPALLRTLLSQAIDQSFNQITIDGDTSTNDMCAVLANGASGVRVEDGDDVKEFAAALGSVLISLASSVARDGEGATKLIEVVVSGASSDSDARKVAKAVAGSSLVKSAVWGADPNPGRIAAAAGRAGADLVPEKLTVSLGKGGAATTIIAKGALNESDLEKARAAFQQKHVHISIDLGLGAGASRAWGCDLTPEYVDINGRYTT